jgi:hypothetical protein
MIPTEGTIMTVHPTSDRLVPALTPEMTAAAAAEAATEWLDLRQHPGAACAILIRTPTEAVTTWVLRGLQHDYRQADRQLLMARLGEGKWKEMKLDLLNKPGALVYPLDYCPEISPEEVAYLKTDEGLMNLATLRCCEVTRTLADMLHMDEAEFFMDFGLEWVEHMLSVLAEKVAALTTVRDMLQAALPETWPGTTPAEWEAHHTAEGKTAAVYFGSATASGLAP